MKKNILKITKWLAAAGFVLAALPAGGQALPSGLPSLNMTPTLSLTAMPQTPTPQSVVTITAALSGATNLDNADYTWSVNGVEQAKSSGQNQNVFAFQVGNLGAVYKIGVSAMTQSGNRLSDFIALTVGDFDLTWNADSQAPASYRGKILPTRNSSVIISAFPRIYAPGTKNLIAGGDLTYNWNIDDKFIADKSGAGKSSISVKIDAAAGGDKSVRLEIKTADNSVSAIKNISIPVARPQTFIYFRDPETNFPYGSALKNLRVQPQPFDFIARNYFFNAFDKNLKWQWSVNGNEVGGGNNPWLASIDLSSFGRYFAVQIQATVQNPANADESTQSTLNIQLQ